MKEKYSLLVITDHSSHKQYDSFYDLVMKMTGNERCKKAVVISRDNRKNDDFFCDPENGRIWGREVDSAFSFKNSASWYEEVSKNNAASFDAVILRLDHPISNTFLTTLRKVLKKSVIINDPLGIIRTSNKEYLLNFSDVSPWVRISSSLEEVLDISIEKEVVLKPLLGYGGIGILRAGKGIYYIGNKQSCKKDFIVEVSKNLEKHGKILVTEYLPNVSQGDKRVLVANGVVLGAILRTPSPGSWVCNLNQGGVATSSKVEKEEYIIAKKIWNKVRNEGVVLFGFDTLVGNDGYRFLSEINTSNVGGFLQLEKYSKKDITLQVSNLIWGYICDKLA